MQKKYFFFDYDGTITNIQTEEVVPSFYTVLEELKKNGHFVALCTGRAHYKAQRVMNDLGIENMVCAGGGGIVLNKVLVHNHPLDLKKIKDIIKAVEKQGIGYLVALEDSQKTWASNDLFRQQCGGRKEPTTYIIDPDFDIDKVEQIYKAYFAIKTGEEDKIPNLGDIDYLRLGEGYVVIQHNKKKQGIIEMMQMLNAPLEDVVTFGDDRNDIVMCDDRWLSIAMGSAPDILKEKASYITDTSVNDGIYKACKKFGWI